MICTGANAQIQLPGRDVILPIGGKSTAGAGAGGDLATEAQKLKQYADKGEAAPIKDDVDNVTVMVEENPLAAALGSGAATATATASEHPAEEGGEEDEEDLTAVMAGDDAGDEVPSSKNTPLNGPASAATTVHGSETEMTAVQEIFMPTEDGAEAEAEDAVMELPGSLIDNHINTHSNPKKNGKHDDDSKEQKT